MAAKLNESCSGRKLRALVDAGYVGASLGLWGRRPESCAVIYRYGSPPGGQVESCLDAAEPGGLCSGLL